MEKELLTAFKPSLSSHLTKRPPEFNVIKTCENNDL